MGLSLAASVPDQSTICNFCQFLENEGLIDSLLVEINCQLSIQGLWIRTGEISIIDGSVIEAKWNWPKKKKIVITLKTPK